MEFTYIQDIAFIANIYSFDFSLCEVYIRNNTSLFLCNFIFGIGIYNRLF